MFSLGIFSDARGNLWTIYKIQVLNMLLMFVWVFFFPNDFPEKCTVFFLIYFTTRMPIVFMDGEACSAVRNTIGATFPIGLCSFTSPPHLPDSSKIHFSVWDFPFIPIKTKPAKFPPPNCVSVLKRQQPPALVLLGMKRGHRSCKAEQTCEMGFTRCSATSGVAMYDSVCAKSRKGKAFKATPAITSYKP